MRKQSTWPRLCISATGNSPQELWENARGALQHNPFVELRLDGVPDPLEFLPMIPGLLAAKTPRRRGGRLVLQATCRRVENGGRFRGSVGAQIEILQKAAATGCRLLDLEIESAEAAGHSAVVALRQHASLILSFHDFHAMPALQTAARRLRQFPADLYKLVGTATRQSDNCLALDFVRSVTEKDSEPGQWIAFCMGEAGIPSRVLALSRGSAFVYAACPPVAGIAGSSRASEPAAPGQLDFKTLQNCYHVTDLSQRSAIYGLLGSPVGHSLGAVIHNAAFRARKLDAVYLPLLSSDLKDFRKAAGCYPLAGCSVTIPHKQKILRLLDRVDRTVRDAGAANTVRVRRGKWEAINTDIEGIVVPLRRAFQLSERQVLPASFRAVIVGTGGAARAAFAALRSLRCRHIFVAGRNPAKARKLARELNGQAMAVEALSREQFDLLLHATSVGMWPRKEECFLRPEQIIASTVFDLVYNPPETRLLQMARRRGCRTISGLEMFLVQAARQFEYWTGLEAPRRRMRQVAQQELQRFELLGGESES
ncbi:MAG: shikimate dehydrogenase [Acidobacteria bacterium RIFCSPLOWO2_12_FULL_59_11]|nr:MAG: shikimate dehydrogenase [Acidobacteria bacterium RIFCSPLOWO2_12_FULL_59_11]